MGQPVRYTRGFSAFEFVVVCLIVALVVWAIMPRFSDALKLAHEQAVENTGVALRESVQWAHKSWYAKASEPSYIAWKNHHFPALKMNARGFPIAEKTAQHEPLNASHCALLWNALLGDSRPSADVSGKTAYRILIHFEAKHGLGCLYRYRLAEAMGIYYFPDDGTVVWRNRFEGND